MNAEKVILQFADLSEEINEKLSLYIKSFRFTNFTSALYPFVQITFSSFAIKFLKNLEPLFYKFAAVNIFVAKDNNKFCLLKGYVLRIKDIVKNNELYYQIDIEANTAAIYRQQIKSFDLFESVNPKALIVKILNENNLQKTYDNIIFPETMSNVDSSLYSSTSQTVYNYIENILNDLQIKLFTTCYKIGSTDQQILYFYDTGDYAESVIKYKQILSNNNVFESEGDIDYSFFPDKIQIESEQGFGDLNFATEKTINIKNLKSLGFNRINERKNINIPEMLLTKKIKSISSDVDSSNYGISVLRDSVNQGVQRQVKTNSIFTNIFDNSQGVWALGKKIIIENDILKTILNPQFGIYLQNNDKYYFVLSGIDYFYDNENISCNLTITPSDLIYLK